MSLDTFSVFYYGYLVDETNRYLNFKEGAGPELSAEIEPGRYALEELLDEVQNAMNEVGSFNFTVTSDRNTRKVTISSTAIFSLLTTSGSQFSTSIFPTLGFTGSDRTGAITYTGNNVTGSIYEPQFILQDHISSDNKQRAIDAVIRKTTTGQLEVVKYGTEKFVQVNIKFANDFTGDGKILKRNANGVSDLQDFMQWLVTKGSVELMPDIADKNTFETLVLESTPDDAKGLGYELKELYTSGLPNFFETGKLLFRVKES